MTRIIQRHDTAANWASVNPILAKGEMGVEDDTRKFKFGDGTTAWADLDYAGGETGGSVDAYTKAETDNLLAEKNNKVFDIGKFTVVGSPTITNDGIASGFNSMNYIQIPQCFTTGNTWEITIKITTSDKLTSEDYFCNKANHSLVLNMSNSKLSWSLSSNGTSWNLFTNKVGTTTLEKYTTYYIKAQFTGAKYELLLSQDGINWTLESSFSSTTKLYNTEYSVFGVGRTISSGLTGQVDLKQFLITVDGREVLSGSMDSTKPIYDAIATNKNALSEFKTDTSNNFSAVNSALNEKANLSDLSLKQNTLVSGTNIKTINGNSILGEGNLVISGGEGGTSIDDSTTSTTTTWSSEKINAELTTTKTDVQNLQTEVVNAQGDIAALDGDVSMLNNVVEDHTTSISSINDSIAQLMEDVKISDSNTISVGSSSAATYSPYTASGGVTVDENTGIATIPTSGAPQLSLDFTPAELAGHAFEIQAAFKVRESAPFNTYVAILQEAASYANRTSPQIFVQANGSITFDIPNADGTGWLIGDAPSNVTVSGGDTVVAKLICDGTKITSSVSKNGSTPVEATIYDGAYVRTGTVKFMYGEVSAYAANFASTIESVDLKNTYVKYDGAYIWQPATNAQKTLNVKVSSEDDNSLLIKDDGLFVPQTANTPVATANTAGVVKPDGTTVTVTEDGTISTSVATINGVPLSGELTPSALSLQSELTTSGGINIKQDSGWTILNGAYSQTDKLISLTSGAYTSGSYIDSGYNYPLSNESGIATYVDGTKLIPKVGVIMPMMANTTFTFYKTVSNQGRVILGNYDGEYFTPVAEICVPKNNISSTSFQKYVMSEIINIYESDAGVFQTQYSQITSSIIKTWDKASSTLSGLVITSTAGTYSLLMTITIENIPYIGAVTPNGDFANKVNNCTHIWYLNAYNTIGLGKDERFLDGDYSSELATGALKSTSHPEKTILPDYGQIVLPTYISVKTDGVTTRINDSGALEAIAPANMVKLVRITQSEYDSLETKDENTMYIATGDSTTSIYIGSIKIQ